MATKKEREFWTHNNRLRHAYKIKNNKECPVEYWYYQGWVYAFDNPNYKPFKSTFPYLENIQKKNYIEKMRVADFEKKARNLHRSIPLRDRIEIAERRIVNTIGKDAMNALKDGTALLHVWRRTNPYNQWVEDKDGNMLWHSGEGYENRISFHSFKKVKDSKDLIGMSLSLSEIGMPDHSLYRLHLDVSYEHGI